MSALNTTTSKAKSKGKANAPKAKVPANGKASASTVASVAGATKTVAAKSVVKKQARPTHDQIAARAYEIWLSLGRPIGRDEANWAQAEQELIAKLIGKRKGKATGA